MKKIEASKFLKGIGILLVVICHISNSFGIRYATPLGGIGVSIFLFLSGYGLNESYKKFGLNNYLKKRLSKILIPYFIIMIFNYFLKDESFKILSENIFLINTPTFMWFIKYILFLYIMFFMINFLTLKANFKNIIWIITGLITFSFGNDLWAEQSFVFFLGILLSQNKEISNCILKKNIKKISLIFLILGLIGLLAKQIPFIRNGNKFIFILFEIMLKNMVALAIVFYYYFRDLNRNYLFKFTQKIGEISYEIYLSHSIFYYILKENSSFKNVLIFLLYSFGVAKLLSEFLNHATVKHFENNFINLK